MNLQELIQLRDGCRKGEVPAWLLLDACEEAGNFLKEWCVGDVGGHDGAKERWRTRWALFLCDGNYKLNATMTLELLSYSPRAVDVRCRDVVAALHPSKTVPHTIFWVVMGQFERNGGYCSSVTEARKAALDRWCEAVRAGKMPYDYHVKGCKPLAFKKTDLGIDVSVPENG